jgi:hypothetical protein
MPSRARNYGGLLSTSRLFLRTKTQVKAPRCNWRNQALTLKFRFLPVHFTLVRSEDECNGDVTSTGSNVEICDPVPTHARVPLWLLLGFCLLRSPSSSTYNRRDGASPHTPASCTTS